MLGKINLLLFVLFFFCSSFASAAKFSSDAEYQLIFTPGEDDCAKQIVQVINNAKHQVLVQAYSFTDWDIAHALLQAKRRGVQVSVLLDRSQKDKEIMRFLLFYKIDCSIDSANSISIAHNKIIIVDRKIVVGGSYNYSKNAAHRNAENITIIKDRAFAAAFYANWKARKEMNKTRKSQNCAL